MFSTVPPFLPSSGKDAAHIRALAVALASLAALTSCGPDPDAARAATSLASATPDPAIARRAVVAGWYEKAKRRDVAALEAAERAAAPSPAPSGRAAASPAPTADPALALAVYIAGTRRDSGAFVGAYPTAYDAINRDYGDTLRGARAVPGGDGFPVRTLAELAAHGDAGARVKLLQALVEADGGLGGTYAGEAGRTLAAIAPGAALDALAALPPAQRIVATSAVDWCGNSPRRILAFVPTPMPTPAPAPTASGAAAPPPTAAPTAPPSGATPTPSPSPRVVELVQRQIRQSVAACAAVRARATRPARGRRTKGPARHGDPVPGKARTGRREPKKP